MGNPFIIERTYQATPTEVWEALTNPEKMKEWYFDIPGFKPEVGYKFEFFGGTEQKHTNMFAPLRKPFP